MKANSPCARRDANPQANPNQGSLRIPRNPLHTQVGRVSLCLLSHPMVRENAVASPFTCSRPLEFQQWRYGKVITRPPEVAVALQKTSPQNGAERALESWVIMVPTSQRSLRKGSRWQDDLFGSDENGEQNHNSWISGKEKTQQKALLNVDSGGQQSPARHLSMHLLAWEVWQKTF